MPTRVALMQQRCQGRTLCRKTGLPRLSLNRGRRSVKVCPPYLLHVAQRRNSMFSRILVPTDGTQQLAKAMPMVRHLAQRSGASVVFVCVEPRIMNAHHEYGGCGR
jgi:hypothetical protein